MIKSHDTLERMRQTAGVRQHDQDRAHLGSGIAQAVMRTVSVVGAAVFVTLLLAMSGWTSSSAQSAPWHVVQAADGTLYLLADGVRYTLTPDAIGDDELAELPDGGAVGGQLLGLPLQPTATPAPTAAEPLTVLPTPSPQIVVVVASPTLELRPTSTPIPPTPLPISPTVTATLAAEQPSTVSGMGVATSPLFSIRGGDYIISWSFSPGARSCFAAGASLHNVDGSTPTTLGGKPMEIPLGQSTGGELHVSNLVGSQYYVSGLTTCTWSVTVRPE